MLPLIAIGGVIGAIVSAGKGASWISDQIDAAKGAEATATSDKQSQTAGAAPFDKALAAQAAGQSVPTAAGAAPAAAAPAPAPAGILAAAHDTDYTSLARMQAGIAAYGSIGEYRGHHSGHSRPPALGDDTTAPIAGSAPQYGAPASAGTQSQGGLGSLANL